MPTIMSPRRFVMLILLFVFPSISFAEIWKGSKVPKAELRRYDAQATLAPREARQGSGGRTSGGDRAGRGSRVVSHDPPTETDETYSQANPHPRARRSHQTHVARLRRRALSLFQPLLDHP